MRGVKEKTLTATEIALKEGMNRDMDRKRKILAIGYYYCPSSDTYGKGKLSCIKAGYSESHAEKRNRNILDIDKFQDRMGLEWKKFEGNLVYLNEMVYNWLQKHKGNPDTKEIREAFKGIRAIGESLGKFIRREEKIEHKIEEKRAVLVFKDKNEEIKYWLDIERLAKAKQREIEA